MSFSTFIIAEAGVNHNGDLECARRMVRQVKQCGADAIKFQTFDADRIVTKTAPRAEYQKCNDPGTRSQYEMLKKLQLPCMAYRELIRECQQQGLIFLSSAFDEESVDVLCALGVELFKIPSGEITNLPYLRTIGALRKKIILSSGMADLKEIEDALHVLIAAGTRREDITVLHCTTDYPALFEEVNLRAMHTIRDTLKVRVGYSDHTQGIEVALAAVALGAEVIEKHFTLDTHLTGPDHKASLAPEDFCKMVWAIRNVEQALGSTIKKPSARELQNRDVVRKSVVAKRLIQKGELLSPENITVKRPGTGLSPMQWDRVMGTAAIRVFQEDEEIEC